MTKHVIDAKNKKLGRIASQAAMILMGKDTASFAKNVAPEVEVEIVNASKTAIDEKKKLDKKYITHSGYPGGQKEESLGNLIERKGIVEVYKRAVYGMLPDNKLRSRMMTRLIITE
jgi:large subunit ribosomal protein L13